MFEYPEFDRALPTAIEHFWLTRIGQSEKSAMDQGSRRAVTGGKQMDGFLKIVIDTIVYAGLAEENVYANSNTQENLPGYFRPEKRWDVIAIADDKLVAAIELKSMASSFGNNFNNRVEEVVGSATDLWTAYREGAIPLHPRPWLGYLMLLVHSQSSTRAKSLYEPHFRVFQEFRGAGYAELFRLMMEKLIRENLYTSTCLILTPEKPLTQKKNPERYVEDKESYIEPDPNLAFRVFLLSLYAHVRTFVESQNR